jgi:anti-sigma B factor antagonist
MSDSPHDGQWYGAAPLQADTEIVAPGVQLIRISGDLDIDTCVAASELIRAEIAPPAAVVLLDLSAVTFCSSSGLRVLIQASQHAAQAGVVLRIIGAGRPVLRPLQVTGLDRHLHVFSTAADALAASCESGGDA